MKPAYPTRISDGLHPAAFRRLCVETVWVMFAVVFVTQPPSGGCVLKQMDRQNTAPHPPQPPSGGCVLKP